MKMDRNQIIEQLFTGKNFNSCIDRMEPAHLRDDLRQDVILALLETPVEQFQQIRNIEHYAVRIILNLIQSSTSPFYNKFRRCHEDFVEDIDFSDQGKVISRQVNSNVIEYEDMEERRMKEELEDHAFREIERLPFYYCEIIKLYMKEKTFRAMETRTMIPYSTCFKSVQKGIEMLRRRALINENPVMTRNIQKYEPWQESNQS